MSVCGTSTRTRIEAGLAVLCVVLAAACNRTRDDAPVNEARPATPPRTGQRSAPAEHARYTELVEPGAIGEPREADVYWLELLATRVCNDVPPLNARTPLLVGVEVELRAKAELGLAPRDMTLRSGGTIFQARTDPGRRPTTRCAPLLESRGLAKGEVVRGWLLFELPLPEPPGLELSYTPTRWGGAGSVRVRLNSCISCSIAR